VADSEVVMKVLVACEESGTVRDAFAKLGHDAISCDLQPSRTSGKHYQGNVFDIINDGFDLMIAHPPCTFLCVSGARWLDHPKYPNRRNDRDDATDFFMALALSDIPMIALENPIGYISTAWRKPDQIIRPYHFGDDASKATCLWLKGLPKLNHTNVIEPSFHYTKKGVKYDKWWFESSLISNLEERRKFRSKTFQGIADAMAAQWGVLL
jgi:hypothetical protein